MTYVETSTLATRNLLEGDLAANARECCDLMVATMAALMALLLLAEALAASLLCIDIQ